MHRSTDGPSPLPLQPGIIYLDRQQSVEECAAVAWLLDVWLTETGFSLPSPCMDPGGPHAAD